MLRRKHCSAKTQALKTSVPYGSTKVEYLETTGSQWIQTNYFPCNNTKISSSCYFVQPGKNGRFFGNGSTYDGVIDAFTTFLSAYGTGAIILDFGNIRKDKNNYNLSVGNHEIVVDKNGIMIDDIMALQTNHTITFQSTHSLSFFAANGKTSSSCDYWKIYNFLISENGNINHSFIPSIDKTGTPCMFDLVSRKNFYNAGTGQFSYPYPYPIPNVIPSNYTRIDYLESTGTQWIDSELCMDSYDIRICIKGQALQTTDKKTTICGYWSNYGISPEECAVFIFNDPIKNTTQTQQIMLNNWFDFSINPFEVFTIDVSRNKNDKNVICAINGIAKILNGNFNTKLKSNSPETFILFGVYSHSNSSSSEVGTIKNLFTGRVWYTDLYKDGMLVLKFVPCLDPTGTPCMYDTVTQTTYYNAGTGDFLYPSPTSSTTYSMRRPQAEYAKMTDTGVRRLYHVPVDYEGSIEEYASENGFKLLNETESPNEEGKYYAFRWVETDTEITTEWYETEPPTDEFGQVIENNNEQQSTTFNLRRPAPIDNTVYTNNAQWAKITDTGVHKIYHTPIGYEGSLEDYAIENGYKQLIETESPNEEGKYYAFRWVETDDSLTTEWFEIEPPQDEFIEENLDNPTE